METKLASATAEIARLKEALRKQTAEVAALRGEKKADSPAKLGSSGFTSFRMGKTKELMHEFASFYPQPGTDRWPGGL